MRREYQGYRGHRNPKDIHEALAFLQPEVREATIEVSAELARQGVPHTVVGGVAVNAHGHSYNTTDVDFLVRDSEFPRRGPIVLPQPFPIEYAGVRIDYLSEHIHPVLADYPKTVDKADAGHVIPVIPIEPLVLMKLIAWRPKDRAAIIGLLQKGLFDDVAVDSWFADVLEPAEAEEFQRRLDVLVQRAEEA